MSPKPKLAVDFDGTLVKNETPFKEATYGETFVGAVEFIRALAEKYDIVIFSARATTFRGKDAILNWVKQHNLRAVISDVTNQKKYSFTAYIDDRAISFNSPADYLTIADALGTPMYESPFKSKPILADL